MIVDANNIHILWLLGESGINQHEQIVFLYRLYYSKLPITKRSENIMKKIMVIKEQPAYRLSAGWSLRNGNNNGWFVGFVEVENIVYFFATNIEPEEKFNMDMFSMIRKSIIYKALDQMNIAQIK